jgi:hypothetical protein
MSQPDKPVPPAAAAENRTTAVDAAGQADSAICRRPAADDKVLCERCGAEMFRMHAVWRCPDCRFKTDCCGW